VPENNPIPLDVDRRHRRTWPGRSAKCLDWSDTSAPERVPRLRLWISSRQRPAASPRRPRPCRLSAAPARQDRQRNHIALPVDLHHQRRVD
jgi:hypothetical protein